MPNRRGHRADRRARGDYAPTVRPRSNPPGPSYERRPMPTDQGPFGVRGQRWLIAAANTTAAAISAADTDNRIRLVYLDLWLDTGDLEIVEVYWGDYATIQTSAGGALFQVPFNAAYERFTRTWTVGLGPVGDKGEQLTARRTNATAGQLLYGMTWWTKEEAQYGA